ncbi:MAG: InlB B-repeat-containing protein [Treponema sp.]|nr:InlB B-repeat-containing protein [Treponema sp.]
MKETLKYIRILTLLGIIFVIAACGDDNGGGSITVTYTVTFNSNGGSAVLSQTVSGGDKAARPIGVSQQVNFALEGWYTDNNSFENKWDFDTNTVTGNITLFARWQAVSQTDYEDFGAVLVTTTYTAANTTHWINALEAIANGGNNKAYIINITDDFSVESNHFYNSINNTIGDVSDVIVSLRGTGNTISTLPASEYEDGNILYIGSGQSFVLRNVNLKEQRDANYVGGHSGIVHIDNGAFILREGTVSGNYNEEGWTVSHGVYIKDGSFVIYGGKISDNMNGVYMSEGIINMYGGKISSNEGYGVAVNNGSFTMHEGEISENEIYGVFGMGCSFTMNGGNIVRNTNAGVYLGYSSSTFTMNGGNIDNNNGYGVYASGNFIMNGGSINGNNCTGVYFEGTSFTMNGGSINGNTGEGNGGGVYIRFGTFIMNNGTISENIVSTFSESYGSNFGGGVLIYGTSFTMNGGIISDNIAGGGGEYKVGHGGGVCITYGGNFTMNGGTISGNTAYNSPGGGVYVGGIPGYESGGVVYEPIISSFTMTSGIIRGNTARDTEPDSRVMYGGGLFVALGDFNKTSGIIYGKNEGSNSNTADDTYGHTIYYYDYNTGGRFYRDTTLGLNDNISTDNELPANTGETLNGWTKREAL